MKKKGDHEIFVVEEAAGLNRERVITQTDSFSVPSAFDVHRSVLERSSGGKAELVRVRSRERRERPRENFWIARLTRAATTRRKSAIHTHRLLYRPLRIAVLWALWLAFLDGGCYAA